MTITTTFIPVTTFAHDDLTGVGEVDHHAARALISTIIEGARTAAAGAGTQSITGAGFTPTGMLAKSCEDGVADKGFWGFTDDADSSKGMSLTPASGPYNINGAEVMEVGDGAGNLMRCSASFTADGVDLEWLKSGTGSDVNFAICFLGVG